MGKQYFLVLIILCIPAVLFGMDINAKHLNWMTDSYHYGKKGNECSRIYYEYGTDKWTFNSDDPTLLKKLFEACKVGAEDRLTGHNNLSQILDDFKKQ